MTDVENRFKVIVLKGGKPKSDVKVQIYGQDPVKTNDKGLALLKAGNKFSLFINGSTVVDNIFWATFEKEYLTKSEFVYFLD